MALCSSAATTDESTPPDSPSSTLPVPTCARTRSMASSMMLPTRHAIRAPADVPHETLQQLRALLRVRDFRMELHAVEAPLLVAHRGERRVIRERRGDEAFRQRLDAVAVAHPHIEHARGPCDRADRQ